MRSMENRKLALSDISLGKEVAEAAFADHDQLKRVRLGAIAARLRGMFRHLSDELVLDREQSLALIAEYRGIMAIMAEEISEIREGKLGVEFDRLAEKLEKGVSYLIGFFSVFHPGRSTWRLDRTEIKGNLQKVWPTVRQIEAQIAKTKIQ